MSDIEVEGYYKREAKDLITLLFDKRFLNDELSRESIDWLEDYIGFLFQSKSETAAKCAVLTAKMRDKKE
ncbi:MAG: hypothetical protein KAR40_11360 [Candidatus Sabulitectum sp.]|nr:hypothetical protein [Candidatus Sabulitectum sp.]